MSLSGRNSAVPIAGTGLAERQPYIPFGAHSWRKHAEDTGNDRIRWSVQRDEYPYGVRRTRLAARSIAALVPFRASQSGE